ncbi:MAG TPA: serine/threonine-protein kinase [Ktedonobacterales bacterium]|nr:serine/threonine-protein kinase [Ktedonobacterales bacterium]
MARLEGQTIGGWQLQSYLGGGEHGEVYLVEQAAQKQAVMRVIQLRSSGVQAAAGPSLAGRFSQEAQRLVELRHASILPLYEYGQQNDLGYLVTGYAPDGSLQDAFTPGRPSFRFGLPLTAQAVGGILEQVAAGLTYAHGRGVWHGNLKPTNMLVSPDARGNLYLLLSDFSLPRLLGGSLVTASTVFYAAPEVFYNQPSEASDQYSLAMILYQLLTGRLPFGGDVQQVMQQQMQAAPAPLRSLNPNVPPLVETVMMHALAKHPLSRWPSVAAFALAYREALTGRSSVSQPAVPGYAPTPAAWPAQAAPAYAQPAVAVPAPVIPPPQAAPALQPMPSPTMSQQPPTVAASSWNAPPANEDGGQDPPTNPYGYGPRPLIIEVPVPQKTAPRRSRKLIFAFSGVSIVAVALAIVLLVVLLGGKPGGAAANNSSRTPTGTSTGSPTPILTPTPNGPQMIQTDQFVTAIATTADTVAGDGQCDNTFPLQSTPQFQGATSVNIVYTANLTQNQLALTISVNKMQGDQSIAQFSPVPPSLCAGQHTYVTPFNLTDDTQKGFGTYRVQITCILCSTTGTSDATIFFQVS